MNKWLIVASALLLCRPAAAFDETVAEAQALNGDAQAALQLGRYYRLEKKDPKKAERFFKIAADNHNPEALYHLAKIYDESREGKHPNKEVVAILEQSAGLGWTEAQVMLGRIYQFGRKGIAKDLKKAQMWYDLAAAKGSREALHQLDVIYASSKDGYVKAVQKDDNIAWLDKAVSQGNAEAAYNLAVLAEQGQSIPKNEKRAAQLYQTAADAGIVPAQAALGAMYADGRGVKRNEKKALSLLTSSAEQGYVEAQRKLAHIYAYRLKDYPKAYAWQVISLSAMFPNASDLTEVSPELERLLRSMTPEQIKDGHEQASRLVTLIRKNKKDAEKKQEDLLKMMEAYKKSFE